MSRLDPPRADELEVSIIGPGRGECVIVHLGNNEWCIVDSCVPRGHREPVGLEYLRAFHNEALDRVRLIVATHWHDDHIRGLAAMLEHMPNAQFACSQALNTDQFFTLVESAAATIQGASGVDEFARIFRILIEREARTRERSLVAPTFAIENRPLLQLSSQKRSCPAVVRALSPSDGTVRLALGDIATLIPKAGEVQRRITNRAPNCTSVVVWVEMGARRALLGADLEHTGRSRDGWTAVLGSHNDPCRATVYKVPHHGSINADCPEVWTRMLIKNPIAIVTPFTSGKPLPTSSDIQRMRTRTSRLFCTSSGPGRPPARDAIVEKEMRRNVTNRRVVDGAPGHVRVRWPAADGEVEPSVELFHYAYLVPTDAPPAA
jgi:hypothetical protein